MHLSRFNPLSGSSGAAAKDMQISSPKLTSSTNADIRVERARSLSIGSDTSSSSSTSLKKIIKAEKKQNIKNLKAAIKELDIDVAALQKVIHDPKVSPKRQDECYNLQNEKLSQRQSMTQELEALKHRDKSEKGSVRSDNKMGGLFKSAMKSLSRSPSNSSMTPRASPLNPSPPRAAAESASPLSPREKREEKLTAMRDDPSKRPDQTSQEILNRPSSPIANPETPSKEKSPGRNELEQAKHQSREDRLRSRRDQIVDENKL